MSIMMSVVRIVKVTVALHYIDQVCEKVKVGVEVGMLVLICLCVCL